MRLRRQRRFSDSIFGFGAPFGARFEGAGGGGDDDPPAPLVGDAWVATLPEDMRTNESLLKFKEHGQAGLAQGYTQLQSKIGSMVSIPGENATDAERLEFNQKLGTPAKPEDYEIPTENMPADVKLSDPMIAAFRNEAMRLGITKTQFAGLVRFQATQVGEQQKALDTSTQAARDEGVATIKGEWGQAYDEKLQLAQTAAAKFGGDAFKQFLNDSGLGDNPHFLRTFAAIGKAMSEHELMGGGGGQTFKMSPAEAKAAIQAFDLDAEKQKAYTDAHHPAHAATVAEKEELFKMAYPGKVQSSALVDIQT